MIGLLSLLVWLFLTSINMMNVISELPILNHSCITSMNLLVQSVQILFQCFCIEILWDCYVFFFVVQLFCEKRSLSGMLLWSLEKLFYICFSYDNFIWKLVETFSSVFFFLSKISFFLSFFERLNPPNSRLVFFFLLLLFFSSFMLVSGYGIR